MPYHHILLATDLSEDFDIVAEKVSLLAKRFKSKLSVVHVLEHTPVIYGGGEFSIPLDMSLEEHLSQNVRQALSILGNRFNIDKEDQYVAHGSIRKQIVALAQQLNVDLIAVGSHGHTGVEVLLGSVANGILHAAKCDVLAVRIKR